MNLKMNGKYSRSLWVCQCYANRIFVRAYMLEGVAAVASCLIENKCEIFIDTRARGKLILLHIVNEIKNCLFHIYNIMIILMHK